MKRPTFRFPHLGYVHVHSKLLFVIYLLLVFQNSQEDSGRDRVDIGRRGVHRIATPVFHISMSGTTYGLRFRDTNVHRCHLLVPSFHGTPHVQSRIDEQPLPDLKRFNTTIKTKKGIAILGISLKCVQGRDD